VSRRAIPPLFVNCPRFVWGASEGGSVYKFTADYGDPWTTAQLRDITAITNTTLSIVGNYLQGVSVNGTITGFSFKQAMRLDSVVQKTKSIANVQTYGLGNCYTQVPISNVTEFPNPGYLSRNQTNAGLRIVVNGTIYGSTFSLTTLADTWYTYTQTFSASAITISRADDGRVYSLSGTYSLDTSHYVQFASGVLQATHTTQWGAVSITGAVSL
jgi:hypothetical protein